MYNRQVRPWIVANGSILPHLRFAQTIRFMQYGALVSGVADKNLSDEEVVDEDNIFNLRWTLHVV